MVWQERPTIQASQSGRSGRSVAASTSRRANSEAGMLRSRLVLATFLVVTCAACSHNEASPAPSPSPDPTTSAPSATTSSIPTELAGYNEKQLAAYETARGRVRRVHQAQRQVLRGRTDDRRGEEVYQRNALDWSTAWGNLAQVANNNVTVPGSQRRCGPSLGRSRLGGPRETSSCFADALTSRAASSPRTGRSWISRSPSIHTSTPSGSRSAQARPGGAREWRSRARHAEPGSRDLGAGPVAAARCRGAEVRRRRGLGVPAGNEPRQRRVRGRMRRCNRSR